jgi:hypothetical protein
MKIRASGSSPLIGPDMPERGSKTYVNGRNFWNVFVQRDPNDFLSRSVTMDETWSYHCDRSQSNNQLCGSIAAHPDQKSLLQKSAWIILASIFCDQDGILLIDYLPKGQATNVEYYSSLLVQLKNICKEKPPREFHQMGLVLARICPGSPGTCNPEETGLPGLPMCMLPTLFSTSGPVGLPPVSWTEKIKERSRFFVRHGGHCCRGDLVGWTKLWIFLSDLQKL